MELKVGDSVEKIIRRKYEFSLDERLQTFIKVCDALSYAHDQGVLHLDIKPDNIQVGRFGEVQLCDWGVAKIIAGPKLDQCDEELLNPDLLNHLTLHGNIKGTPGYMAPEQVKAGGEKSFATDVYGLGGLLYSLMTGARPLESSETEELLRETLETGAQPPSQRFPEMHIPAALEAVAMKALRINSAERYQTVGELQDELRNYLKGYSTHAEEAGFMTEARLFYKRNRAICLTFLAFSAVLTLSTCLFVINLNRTAELAKTAKDKAEQARQLAEKELVWNRQVMEENIDEIKMTVYKKTDSLIFVDEPGVAFGKALNYLDRLVQWQQTPWAYNQRGYVHFLMQEFELAEADFSVNNNANPTIRELSRKYAPLAQAGEALKIETFLRLLDDLEQKIDVNGAIISQIVILMIYDAAKRKSIDEHARAVEKVLRIINPQWQGDFKYDAASRSLKLSGRELSKLALPRHQIHLKVKPPQGVKISLLKTLKLESLDLSGSGFNNLLHLKGLMISKLDVRQTKLGDFSGIEFLTDLRRLTVSPGQVKEKQRLDLPDHLQLVVR